MCSFKHQALGFWIILSVFYLYNINPKVQQSTPQLYLITFTMYQPNEVRCVNSLCNFNITNPMQGFTTCPKCTTNFIILCHPFPITYHKNLKCTKCNNKFYYFTCENCYYLISIKNHRVGTPTVCDVCNNNETYIVCGLCFKPFKSESNRNQEGNFIKCKKCTGTFVYLTCQQCLQPIYSSKTFQPGDQIQCKNVKCRSQLIVKICSRCKSVYGTQLGSNQPHFCVQNQIAHKSMIGPKSSNFQQKTPSSEPSKNMIKTKTEVRKVQQPKSKVDADNTCKICMDMAVECINASCFHLIVCSKCIPKDGKCPLCRKIGEYKKVYV